MKGEPLYLRGVTGGGPESRLFSLQAFWNAELPWPSAGQEPSKWALGAESKEWAPGSASGDWFHFSMLTIRLLSKAWFGSNIFCLSRTSPLQPTLIPAFFGECFLIGCFHPSSLKHRRVLSFLFSSLPPPPTLTLCPKHCIMAPGEEDVGMGPSSTTASRTSGCGWTWRCMLIACGPPAPRSYSTRAAGPSPSRSSSVTEVAIELAHRHAFYKSDDPVGGCARRDRSGSGTYRTRPRVAY